MQHNTAPSHYSSYIAIALINLGPLLGVLLGEWTPFEVVFMYWFENLIIGLFVIARMVYKPQGGFFFAVGGAALSLFFLVHYGMFCLVHGVFVMSIFGDAVAQLDSQSVFSSAVQYVAGGSLKWVALSMLLAHLVLYIQDFMGENIGAAPMEMMKPYRRLIILHIAIIAGGALAVALPSGSFAMMLMLIAFKILSDIKSDKKEREAQDEKKQNRPARMVDQIIAQLDSAESGGNTQASMQINGQTMSYASYAELRDSVQFQQMKKMARLFMSKKDIARLEQALENKIAREEGCSGVILEGEAERVADDIKVIPPSKDDQQDS